MAESDGAFLARLGTDAKVWAAEFNKRNVTDEYQMLCWFANAIESGRSAGYGEGRRVAEPHWPADF